MTVVDFFRSRGLEAARFVTFLLEALLSVSLSAPDTDLTESTTLPLSTSESWVLERDFLPRRLEAPLEPGS